MNAVGWLIGSAMMLSAPVQEAPHAEWSAPVRAAYVGEPITAQLTFVNTSRPDLPRIDVPDGLTITALTSNPSVSQMTSIINGRRSRQARYTFVYRIVARKPGDYEIPTQDVQAGDGTVPLPSLSVTVQPAPPEVQADGDSLMFAHIAVGRTSVYVGESYEATLRLGVRRPVYNGRSVGFSDLFTNVIRAGAVNLADFAGMAPTASVVSLTDGQGDTHEYDVFQIDRTVRADQAGTVRIGPVFVAWDYPVRLR